MTSNKFSRRDFLKAAGAATLGAIAAGRFSPIEAHATEQTTLDAFIGPEAIAIPPDGMDNAVNLLDPKLLIQLDQPVTARTMKYARIPASGDMTTLHIERPDAPPNPLLALKLPGGSVITGCMHNGIFMPLDGLTTDISAKMTAFVESPRSDVVELRNGRTVSPETRRPRDTDPRRLTLGNGPHPVTLYMDPVSQKPLDYESLVKTVIGAEQAISKNGQKIAPVIQFLSFEDILPARDLLQAMQPPTLYGNGVVHAEGKNGMIMIENTQNQEPAIRGIFMTRITYAGVEYVVPVLLVRVGTHNMFTDKTGGLIAMTLSGRMDSGEKSPLMLPITDGRYTLPTGYFEKIYTLARKINDNEVKNARISINEGDDTGEPGVFTRSTIIKKYDQMVGQVVDGLLMIN